MCQKSSDNSYILLMNRDRISRTIERMAYQIDEDRKGEWTMLIAGIKERGAAVAKAIAGILKQQMDHSIYQVHLPEGNGNVEKVSDAAEFPNYFDYALVVDDVIFSGQTMLNSIETVRQRFKIKIVRTAALVDRGHRKVPIDASFYGIKLPTKLDEHVQVCLSKDSPDKVILTTKQRSE